MQLCRIHPPGLNLSVKSFSDFSAKKANIFAFFDDWTFFCFRLTFRDILYRWRFGICFFLFLLWVHFSREIEPFHRGGARKCLSINLQKCFSLICINIVVIDASPSPFLACLRLDSSIAIVIGLLLVNHKKIITIHQLSAHLTSSSLRHRPNIKWHNREPSIRHCNPSITITTTIAP